MNGNANNDSRITSSINRYASANQLDYDMILRKNLQNEKLKQLEQIYLPRMDVNRVNKKEEKRHNDIKKQ